MHIKLFEEFINEIKYRTIKDGPDRTEIIAYYDGEKIGSIIMEVIIDQGLDMELGDDFTWQEIDEMFPKGRTVKLEHMKVDSYYMGEGIGTSLVRKALNHFEGEGITQFYLNASPMGHDGLKKDRLVKFYEKFGFRVILDQGGNALMRRIK